MHCASPADDRETITIGQRLGGSVCRGSWEGWRVGVRRGERFTPYLSNQCMNALKALNTMFITSTTEVDYTQNGDKQSGIVCVRRGLVDYRCA